MSAASALGPFPAESGAPTTVESTTAAVADFSAGVSVVALAVVVADAAGAVAAGAAAEPLLAGAGFASEAAGLSRSPQETEAAGGIPGSAGGKS
jgi:hypothetical protein